MAKAVKVQTTVLPGNRIEVTDPELTVGQPVEVIMLQADDAETEQRMSVRDFLRTLPPRNYSAAEWESIEADFQAERDSWDR